MSGGKKVQKNKGIAHIIAVNMGYGHERPAHVLSSLSVEGEVIVANNYKGIPEKDRKIWETGRKAYEKISRFKKAPIVGKAVFWMMDEMQRIPNFYPRRDLSHPNLQLRNIYYLIHKKNHMNHLIDYLSSNPVPIVSTFSPPAFAAEEFGYPGEIFLLCTDADVSRAWVPLNPKKTRIRYFAPNGRVKERLQLYGVPEKNIELTGFPLPKELIGDENAKITLKALRRRICHLDPKGIFVNHTGKVLNEHFGSNYCRVLKGDSSQVKLAFAVGGAGAQREIGIEIAKSLRREIRSKRIILFLIAGARPEVEKYFKSELKAIGLSKEIGKGVRVLFEKNRSIYFKKFTELMNEIDILWTKPSELSFYTGLGIPIIMAPSVGSQEDFNQRWLAQIGGGINQLNPKYTNEWLFDWIESGSLARMAWNGFIEAPTHGAFRIADIVSGKSNSIHDLPLVV